MVEGILVSFLGVLFFLFLFWKRLKEDYISKDIFSAAFYILAGITIFWLVSKDFLPRWWFWLAFLGVVLGGTLAVVKFKLRVFEVLEALVFGLLPWLSLIFLLDAVINANTLSLIGFLVILIFILSFVAIDSRYKRFTWYKSGRVGFSGLIILGSFFLLRTFIAGSFTDVLSFAGQLDSVLSGTVAFISFLMILNIARQKS